MGDVEKSAPNGDYNEHIIRAAQDHEKRELPEFIPPTQAEENAVIRKLDFRRSYRCQEVFPGSETPWLSTGICSRCTLTILFTGIRLDSYGIPSVHAFGA